MATITIETSSQASIPTGPLKKNPSAQVGESYGGDLRNWMGDPNLNMSNKTIRDVALPGSHDSGTSSISRTSHIAKGDTLDGVLKKTSNLTSPILAPWAKTQDLSIKGQLNIGIRYFDFRIAYRDSKKAYYLSHGLYGDELDSVLRDIQQFIEAHPKEIIIVDVQHLYNMNEAKHRELIEKLGTAFAGKLATQKSFQKLLKDWGAGERIICFYGKTGIDLQQLLPRSSLASPWANAQTASVLKKRLNTGFSGGSIFVTQAVLTPSFGTFAKKLVVFGSLKGLSKEVNKEFPQWLSAWKSSGKKINVVMTDFTSEQLARQIIALNE